MSSWYFCSTRLLTVPRLSVRLSLSITGDFLGFKTKMLARYSKGQIIIFFDEVGKGRGGGGGGGNLSQGNIFLIGGSCSKQFLLGVYVFLQTLFFLLTYNLFQCLQPLQTIYFKIFKKKPTPVKKSNGLSPRKGNLQDCTILLALPKSLFRFSFHI